MEEAGHPPIRSVFVCGGLSKNPLYVSSHADAMRCGSANSQLCSQPQLILPLSKNPFAPFTAPVHSPQSQPLSQ
jgi:hypothetical protein